MMESPKTLEQRSKDVIDYKSSFNFLKCQDKFTSVFLIISYLDEKRNEIIKLRCRELLSLNGYKSDTSVKPCNGGYVYDCVNDSYVVNCIDFKDLGLIPFYFKLKLPGVGMWESIVPMPEKMLLRVLDKERKGVYDKYRQYYPAEEFCFNFIQFLIG